MQAKRRVDGRTTDVEATAEGKRLLCEDKLADGLFQPGQLESYRNEVLRDVEHTAAIVVAPKKLLAKVELPLPLVGVPVEDLADALDAAADQLSRDTSSAAEALSRSYRFRASSLRDLCLSVGPSLSELHIAFRRAYNERAQEIAEGRVRLRDDTLSQGGGFAWFESERPAPSPFSLAHKLNEGTLDVRVNGWTLTELRAHLDALPESERPPEGWYASATRNARKSKVTSEPTPVLRYSVGRLAGSIELCSLEGASSLGRAAADLAAHAADVIGNWLRHGGAQRMARPTRATLEAELAAAVRTATSLGFHDLAATLANLSTDAAKDEAH
jgi:hypothetical protein